MNRESPGRGRRYNENARASLAPALLSLPSLSPPCMARMFPVSAPTRVDWRHRRARALSFFTGRLIPITLPSSGLGNDKPNRRHRLTAASTEVPRTSPVFFVYVYIRLQVYDYFKTFCRVFRDRLYMRVVREIRQTERKYCLVQA
jgi:hypothetical protein